MSARGLSFDLPVSSPAPYPVLHVRNALLSVRISDDRVEGTDGVISAMLDPGELKTSFAEGTANGNPAKCTLTVPLDFHEYADVLEDGSDDPTRECSRISFGAAFTMKRVVLAAAPANGGRPLPVCQ